MSLYRSSLYLVLASLLAVSMAACDQSPQESGGEEIESLTVSGPESATMAYIQA